MSQDLSDIRLKATTLGDLLLMAADERPDHTAVILPHRRSTYAEIRDGALARARALQAVGVRAGDHVGDIAVGAPLMAS